MSNGLPPAQETRKKKARHQNPQLRVVFDTNALYVTPTSIGSASDLVRKEIADLIAEAKYPDLDILWYFPEIVRHERQYQMQTEALKLRSAINKIERLLSHNLALTDKVLSDHVERKINESEGTLGLQEIKLDHNKVDWGVLINAASYRLPPFSAGEKEKGFRDAIVAESFIQLVAESPKTPRICRLVLVTSDELLSKAVDNRISGLPNASVLPGIDELKGLINTLVSDVDEEFIAGLIPKATKLFFTLSDSKNTQLFYKEDVQSQIREKFKRELAAHPEGTTFRSNGTWTINYPNFSRKEGKRIFWTSRIDIDAEVGNVTIERESIGAVNMPSLKDMYEGQVIFGESEKPQPIVHGWIQPPNYISVPVAGTRVLSPSGWYTTTYPKENKVVTQKGKDVYEVLWSAEVTQAKMLKKERIEGIRHVEVNWQPVSP